MEHTPLHPLAGYLKGFHPKTDLQADVVSFLKMHRRTITIHHSRAVADEARCLADQFGANPEKSEQAGWLHDISAIIPPDERLNLALSLDLDLLSEEAAFPILLHQKLSSVIAEEVFGIKDTTVLSAITCHTTLRKNATREDMVVFIADKLRWDQPEEPPYLVNLQRGLLQSLEAAAFSYLNYLWLNQSSLSGALHPWAKEAHHWLGLKLKMDEE